MALIRPFTVLVLAVTTYAASNKEPVLDGRPKWWKKQKRMSSCVGKKIAVIGSGIAGLGAAELLTRSKCGVVVFEANKRLGGNAQTIYVEPKPNGEVIEEIEKGYQGFLKGTHTPMDVAFAVMHPSVYPSLFQLYSELGMEFVKHPLDIGVTIGYKDKRRMIYRSGNEEVNGKGATETGLWFKALEILYNSSMKVDTYDSFHKMLKHENIMKKWQALDPDNKGHLGKLMYVATHVIGLLLLFPQSQAFSVGKAMGITYGRTQNLLPRPWYHSKEGCGMAMIRLAKRIKEKYGEIRLGTPVTSLRRGKPKGFKEPAITLDLKAVGAACGKKLLKVCEHKLETAHECGQCAQANAMSLGMAMCTPETVKAACESLDHYPEEPANQPVWINGEKFDGVIITSIPAHTYKFMEAGLNDTKFGPPSRAEKNELMELFNMADRHPDVIHGMLPSLVYTDPEEYLSTFGPKVHQQILNGTVEIPYMNFDCGSIKVGHGASGCSDHVAPHGMKGPFICWNCLMSEPKSTVWKYEFPTWDAGKHLARLHRMLGTHQGRGNVWYAGIMAVHTRWHEGSLTSGHVAARMLGAEVALNDPKTKDNWASDNMKGLPRANPNEPSAARACSREFFGFVLDTKENKTFDKNNFPMCLKWEDQVAPHDCTNNACKN